MSTLPFQASVLVGLATYPIFQGRPIQYGIL
jgi:hypothetical protein